MYKKYLKSADWKKKRSEKRNRKNGTKKRCAICASKDNLDVHHLSYKSDLTKVEQKDLRIFCRRCHYLTHNLIDSGVIVYKNKNHNSRFAITKSKVKKHLKITNKNMYENT